MSQWLRQQGVGWVGEGMCVIERVRGTNERVNGYGSQKWLG
ncbi:hypothetical protein E6C60_4160 [Paenibacillus algicola]|uniref:Uncharacterized protein n=1 Tax=Paenibacillus algicola TaxID=2565926 RepID=A0A4P8XR68_9BACL|nr:hypothetical protein [Paenibacillus algicola]QCT04865.1 hypothetical protein E6C60_4160 [Paenibacillus algicola]